MEIKYIRRLHISDFEISGGWEISGGYSARNVDVSFVMKPKQFPIVMEEGPYRDSWFINGYLLRLRRLS
tara:strand:- start:485 stop:691 length:207 start_codon:yes stop_codon:yes gene_type:complete